MSDLLGKIGSKFNKATDALGELDPIGGAIAKKALDPLGIFGGDSMSKTGGKASPLGAPGMPGGGIDDILAKMAGNDKNNRFDTSSVANTSTSMGKDGGSSGSSAVEGAAGAGGAGDAMGGIANALQGIMGIVSKILPLVMGFL